MAKRVKKIHAADVPLSSTKARVTIGTQRSRITNGSKLFIDVDGRSATARRYKDIIAEHSSDLGGADLLSEAQRQLIRRAAGLGVQLEATEADLINGDIIDTEDQVRLINAQIRVLTALGLKRKARQVQDLRSYIDAVPAAPRTVGVDGRDGATV